MSEYNTDSEISVTKCERCGKELRLSEWPFCPHGFGLYNAQPNDWPGGVEFENLGHEKVVLYSRSELRRELKARGLVEFVRHVPVPGTDKSPHTSAWTSVDLEAGKALAERQAHTRYRAPNERPDPATLAIIKDVWEQQSARERG